MSKSWRFRAWPEAEFAQLIDPRDATSDEQRRALSPSRASWVLRGIRPDAHGLRALVEGAAGLGRLAGIGERDLLGLLESQVQLRRLLVVAEKRPAPVVPQLFLPAPAAEAREPEEVRPDAPMTAFEPESEFANPGAQAAALRAAARDGVPFCEECARRAAARAAATPAQAAV